MPRVRIIKKNDEYSSEYDLGDIFEITGTWYGGVHIEGKSGVPVSLDKDEYMELDTEPQEQKNPAAGDVPERDILVGDIVQHFKREWVSPETSEYLYKVLAFAQHTETGEKLVIYQGMYPPFKICARPYDMFMSEVDREKYPKIRQKYRFEKIKLSESSAREAWIFRCRSWMATWQRKRSEVWKIRILQIFQLLHFLQMHLRKTEKHRPMPE